MKNYIKIKNLKESWLYHISARNSYLGIWDAAANGFLIAREKFGNTYLFVEYHYDTGLPFGTVHPLKALEKTPFKRDDWIEKPRKYNKLTYRCADKHTEILEYLRNAKKRYPFYEWYGYVHQNGTLHVKRFLGDINDIHEAQSSSFVKEVVYPFRAFNREDAFIELRRRLQKDY